MSDIGVFFGIVLYLSQLGLLAIWLVHSPANMVAKTALLAFVLFPSLIINKEIKNSAALFLYLSGFLAVVYLFERSIQAYKSASNLSVNKRTLSWQFSVKHLLVWTTIISIYCAAASFTGVDIANSPLLVVAIAITSFISIPHVLIPVISFHVAQTDMKLWEKLTYSIILNLLLGLSLTSVVFALSRSESSELAVLYCSSIFLNALITGIWIITVDYDIAQQRKREAKSILQETLGHR